MNLRDEMAGYLRGHHEATDFVMLLGDVLHLWDDLIDKDRPVDDARINDGLWKALIDLPSNPFYRQWFAVLHPLMVVAGANWHAANTFEREGSRLDLAYVIRSDYCNIVLMCAYLIGGRDWALEVAPRLRANWTDETFDDYLRNLDSEKRSRLEG